MKKYSMMFLFLIYTSSPLRAAEYQKIERPVHHETKLEFCGDLSYANRELSQNSADDVCKRLGFDKSTNGQYVSKDYGVFSIKRNECVQLNGLDGFDIVKNTKFISEISCKKIMPRSIRAEIIRSYYPMFADDRERTSKTELKIVNEFSRLPADSVDTEYNLSDWSPVGVVLYTYAAQSGVGYFYYSTFANGEETPIGDCRAQDNLLFCATKDAKGRLGNDYNAFNYNHRIIVFNRNGINETLE